jgi:DNA replication and repair protein RecF
MIQANHYTISMLLRSVSVHNVRSYDLASFEFDTSVTLILGPNGSGKTTILESVYMLMRGTSFRGRDRDVIPYEGEVAEVKLELIDSAERRLRVTLTPDDKLTKQFSVEGTNTARLAAKHRLPVVLFEPDELRLLTSSPQRRRDFIDGIIARLSPTYSTALSRFQRTLLQRNELLKQYETMSESDWQSHLFAWDVKFAELSASIIKARTNFILHANDHLSRIYSDIAGAEHTVTGRYLTPFTVMDDGLQQTILHRLEASRLSDVRRGFTSVGPHRDDIELSLDGHLAAESASRGEMRTIMLAFKLLEVELQTHHSGQKPLILLDDVFSELDLDREQRLMAALSGHQTIITATDLRDELKIDASIISL